MKQKSVLVDTDAIIALTIQTDASHERAQEIKKILDGEKRAIGVTNLVIQEVVTVLSHRISHREAVSFYQRIKNNPPKIVFIDPDLEELAYHLFLRQTKKGTSFVDCANMAVMQKLSLREIFSFDQIYKRSGFKRIGVD